MVLSLTRMKLCIISDIKKRLLHFTILQRKKLYCRKPAKENRLMCPANKIFFFFTMLMIIHLSISTEDKWHITGKK